MRTRADARSSGDAESWAREVLSRRRALSLLACGGASMMLGCDRSPAPPGAAGTATTAAPTPPSAAARAPIVKETPASAYILHGGKNAEMRFEVMAGPDYLTPVDRFFVRNHGTTPLLDARTWSLSVEGSGVEKPYRLTYDELLQMRSRTITRYIDCAGNGRSFYEKLLGKKAEGDPWRLGAWGLAEWTGVPLSEILNRAGLKAGAVDVMPIGLDDAGIERPMPVAKAMEEDTILAYRMNGAPLRPDHGFPARVVVPGWAGIASIKWVGTLRVSMAPIFVKTNTEEYVLIGPDYPSAPPAKGPVITEQVLKSAVALPWPAALPPGSHTIVGYAWSPAGKIDRVDVSLDGGKTFQAATLRGPNVERAGVRWELTAELAPGDLTITPRATDEKGNTQPAAAAQKFNEKGYLFGAVVPHPVKVG